MTLHAIWVRSASSSRHQKIGRKVRAHDRERETDRSHAQVQSLVQKESPELAAGSPPPDGQAIVDRIVQHIQDTSLSASDWRIQHNFFSLTIDRGNRQGLWTLTAPNLFLSLHRDPLLRDEDFFRRGSHFVAIRKEFAKALGDLHHHEHRWQQKGATTLASRRGELVLASALLFGGFCDAQVLGFLPHALQSTHPVQQCGEQMWVDIRIPKASARRLNVVGENEALHRWCIDDLTAALLANFLRHHKASQFPVPSGKNAEKRSKDVASTIFGLMIDLGISTPSGLTPGQWCQGAWAALERMPGAAVPAYLAEYALGRIPSCSLPPNRWVALLNQRVTGSVKKAAQPAVQTPPHAPSAAHITMGTGTPDKDSRAVARRLLDALRDGRSRKLTRADCIRRLEDLIRNRSLGHHVVANLLAHWAIQLLSYGSSWRRKALAPATVYSNYLAPLARPLISLLHSAAISDMRDMDTDEIEELYSDVLYQTRWRDKSLPTIALQEFHSYLVLEHGASPLETTLAGSGRSVPRVRALIVTEAEYHATRKVIQEQQKGNPIRKEILEMALFLGFRAGLRPAEASKLRLSEIFVGETDTVISVRSNRYGTNKNRPSLRRIDVAALCPKAEYQWFSGRVAQLQAWFEKADQTLLLSESPDRNTHVGSDLMREHLQTMLRHVTGNPHIVLYSLRHSALTRLHLCVEIPERDKAIHDPAASHTLDRSLVARLTGGQPNSMKRLHAVTSIAGHASPEMTLTTYLHGMDLVLQEKVGQTLPRLDATIYAQLLGQSPKSTKRFLKDRREPDLVAATSLRPRILRALPTNTYPPPSTQRANVSHADIVAAPSPSPRPVTANDVIRILTDHDNGHPPHLIAKRSELDNARCKAVIDAAEKIASIRSKKGQPRFVSKARREGFNGDGIPLTPSPPQSEEDIHLANRMIERMRPLIRRSGPLGDIGPVIQYILAHTEANNAGIPFYCVDTAKPFVELLSSLADDRSMLFATHVPSQTSPSDAQAQRQYWSEKLKISINRARKRPLMRDGGNHGKLTISLGLKRQSGRRVSARAYRYALHLAAIALLSANRIQPTRGKIKSSDGIK
ncbi:hypothetical protein [Thioalkalivibrio sp. AKL12]|uniref:hypothetical protein n=1 Tax=Thioalkalivibrio sp. AKL12 TaxID=1158159 RepID=UPI0003780DDA|nr:hypothetical protein [Thioalkalivibrio sp. AKL12]